MFAVPVFCTIPLYATCEPGTIFVLTKLPDAVVDKVVSDKPIFIIPVVALDCFFCAVAVKYAYALPIERRRVSANVTTHTKIDLNVLKVNFLKLPPN